MKHIMKGKIGKKWNANMTLRREKNIKCSYCLKVIHVF